MTVMSGRKPGQWNEKKQGSVFAMTETRVIRIGRIILTVFVLTAFVAVPAYATGGTGNGMQSGSETGEREEFRESPRHDADRETDEENGNSVYEGLRIPPQDDIKGDVVEEEDENDEADDTWVPGRERQY